MSKNPKRKKNKVLKTVKKNHIWVTALLCVVVALIMSVFIAVFSSLFFSFVASSKLGDEYDTVSYMAKVYDLNSDTDGENVYAILNEEKRDYFISDNSGNIIYEYGKNTMGNTQGTFSLPITKDGEQKVIAYMDISSEGLFNVDEDGEFSINEISLMKYIMDKYEDANVNLGIKKSSVNLPLWIAIDVKDGKQIFYGKANFIFSFADGLLIAIFITAGIILVVCIVVLMLANMFTTFADQVRVQKVFFTDPVTRSHNWMWFSYRGEKLLKKKSTASIPYAVLDVVFVKYRNYCVCHSVEEGEKMLYRVDKVLNGNLAKNELASHYASANFAVLLKYNTGEELEARLQKLISQLEGIGNEHRFTFHIGVYFVENKKNEKGKPVKRKDIDIEREYNNACTARATLADCDDSGIAFYDEALVEEQKWMDLVLEKHEAALANEEFVVYYQPKYNPQTNELKGVEALIRWNSPDFGFKTPSTFIPILEKNGLIPKIDHFMITHVARDQKAWLDAGYECVPASVNVSRAHFIENDLAVQIRDAVDKEGAPHELIEIEVTESAFFDDKKVMIDTIRQLKEFGFQVSMDDFGSGYSSLNSLKDMPLDVLKLDAEFFRGDMNDTRGEIVVSEAIKLAKSLNMITVAEGVEAKEQVEFLAGKGCDMIQGYYYAKPMPKEEFEERMRRIVKEDSSEPLETEETP